MAGPTETGSTDPRPFLNRALDQTSAIVAGVRPEQLRRTTPCTEFDVEALVGHMVGVGRRVASMGRGEPQEGPAMVTGLPPDQWAKAFDEAREDAFASWADGSAFGKEIVLPWATLPGTLVARVYGMELTTHCWDLAAATGQLDALDPWLAEQALPVAEQMAPADQRSAEMPFAAAVTVAEDAPIYDRLAAFLGRRLA